MIYPDDATLLARGKYSTLGKELREQVERVQKICKTIMHLANPLLDDCQEDPPVDGSVLVKLEECVKNAGKARERIIELCAMRAELREAAWPE